MKKHPFDEVHSKFLRDTLKRLKDGRKLWKKIVKGEIEISGWSETSFSPPASEEVSMNLQSEHPPTKELIAMTTHEIVYEMEMYRAVQVAGDQLSITPPMKRRVIEAQCELARRFARGWVATGKRAGGE